MELLGADSADVEAAMNEVAVQSAPRRASTVENPASRISYASLAGEEREVLWPHGELYDFNGICPSCTTTLEVPAGSGLGVSLAELDEETQFSMFPVGFATYVQSVTDGGVAAAAGVQVGFTLASCNGVVTRGMMLPEVLDVVRGAASGPRTLQFMPLNQLQLQEGQTVEQMMVRLTNMHHKHKEKTDATSSDKAKKAIGKHRERQELLNVTADDNVETKEAPPSHRKMNRVATSNDENLFKRYTQEMMTLPEGEQLPTFKQFLRTETDAKARRLSMTVSEEVVGLSVAL